MKIEITLKAAIGKILDKELQLDMSRPVKAKMEVVRQIIELFNQQNARLTAINAKQAELIKRFLKGNLQIPIRDYSLYQKLNDELFSLQTGEEIIEIDINDPHFNEPI